METINPGSFVRVKNYPPIAWLVIGKTRIKAARSYNFNDDDWDWATIESDDKYTCVMVGDDRKFEIDCEDIIIINDDEFCRSCGDLNCNWHKYTDSEEYGEP